jgi:hypothetical protein
MTSSAPESALRAARAGRAQGVLDSEHRPPTFPPKGVKWGTHRLSGGIGFQRCVEAGKAAE